MEIKIKEKGKNKKMNKLNKLCILLITFKRRKNKVC